MPDRPTTRHPAPGRTAHRTAPRLWQWAVALAVATAALRLLLGALLPPFPDETYYWEWSRHLAWSYFDHPPLIAWLIRGGTQLLGTHVLGIRLLSILAGLVTVLAGIATARRMAGDAAALRASAIIACVPLAAAGLVLATPDLPLMAATALALYAVVRAVQDPRRALLWWLAAGAATGLGLLGKYTAVLIPLGVLAGLLWDPRLRGQLRRPGPYLAALAALALFLPVVAWNAHHDWASFAFQLNHGLGRPRGNPLSREGDLIGGQLGLGSPILFVLMWIAVIRGLRHAPPGLATGDAARTGSTGDPGPRGARNDAAHSVLAATAVVFFGFFMLSALRRPVEPNWPAPFYVPGTVLLAIEAGRGGLRRWLRPGLALGAVLVAVVYVQAVRPILPIRSSRDPIDRAHGWATLARAVQRAEPPDGPVTFAATRYQEASELSFHLPGHPFVHSLNRLGRRNQYDLWPPIDTRLRPAMPVIVVAACDTQPGALLAAYPRLGTLTASDRVRLPGRRGIVRERCIYRFRVGG
ncbi:MAG TPA: glycosyltransferase family 39 protein [Longimicrobiales bacterium]|nr:glycosyltransferase family 39 protein [Longimicrobiales bacterium]